MAIGPRLVVAVRGGARLRWFAVVVVGPGPWWWGPVVVCGGGIYCGWLWGICPPGRSLAVVVVACGWLLAGGCGQGVHSHLWGVYTWE